MIEIPGSKKYKIANQLTEIEFGENGLAELVVNGKTICIGIHRGQIFACAQKCPHAGALLANGHLDGFGNLVCPLHKYKFSPQNGRNISGEGYHLKTFETEQTDEGLFVYL